MTGILGLYRRLSKILVIEIAVLGSVLDDGWTDVGVFVVSGQYTLLIQRCHTYEDDCISSITLFCKACLAV